MLRIAICDDMTDQLGLLTGFTQEYIETQKLSADIRQFSHSDALLTACETEAFHIYLLDMVMPMVSGLEVGRNIRLVSREAQIIYITTEPSYALDAYAVNPLHYLVKPIHKETLFSALELAVSKVNFGNEVVITIKTKAGLRTLAAGQIACCEYKSHAALYTLLGGEQVETTTLSVSFAEHITPLLRDERFLSPHISYIINMSRVEKLTREGFTLRDGGFVPVSAKQYTAVRDAYLDYRLSGEVK